MIANYLNCQGIEMDECNFMWKVKFFEITTLVRAVAYGYDVAIEIKK